MRNQLLNNIIISIKNNSYLKRIINIYYWALYEARNIMEKSLKIKYYHIRYSDNGTSGILKTEKNLKIRRYCRLKDGREAQIIKQAHYKYTCNELEVVRRLTSEYSVGSMQRRLSEKMEIALRSGIPSVRFTNIEREMLSYIYYEDNSITDEDKKVLEKILYN